MLISHEGANFLREWASVMPVTLENITSSTEKVVQVYQQVAENVGPHRQDFYEMLLLIKAAQENLSDALRELPIGLNNTADKIDYYVSSNAEGSDSNPPPPVKKLTFHR